MSKVYVFLKDIDTSQVQGQNKREAWMPTGDRPYYDPAAQRTFRSRAEKRAWLTQHGMREAGSLVTPSQHIKGRQKSKPDPLRAARQAWIASQGGVEGLLRQGG